MASTDDQEESKHLPAIHSIPSEEPEKRIHHPSLHFLLVTSSRAKSDTTTAIVRHATKGTDLLTRNTGVRSL